ncbi:hypothetical protein TrVE_jg10630 [Triparma verrucosa]|uniref:Uncharacterized protein n=1 Tax=Triparma verrucosa TaxID=1606542 RepID=A0A9W7CBP6_9STRA|nr:hypothetical protein TrVE_jg10630 [Triparma verrucosa]
MDVYGDSTGAILIGQQTFPRGMGVVTQQFDAYKESRLLRKISMRETMLQEAMHEAQECANFHPYNPNKLFTALINLRMATANVIEGIEDWRNGLVNPEPFVVAGENYLLKIIKDCDAFRIMPTVDLFGFEVGLRNPFAFPCQPRIAVKQALEERRRKQMLERKKAEKQKKRDKENPNLQSIKKKKKKPEEEKAHTFHLKKGEYVLPRAKEDIEEFKAPHDVAVLMLDFSQVDEANWFRICKLEGVLKDEEERYSKKVSGPVVAGTGWGLERWSKMAWQAPKVKPKHEKAPEDMLLAVNQKHGSDSDEHSDSDSDEEHTPFVKKSAPTQRRTAISGTSLLAAKKSRFTGSALALNSKLTGEPAKKSNSFASDIDAARKKHLEKKRRKNGAFKQKNMVFARMSKEEKRMAMAVALEEEKKAMFDKNRSKNIPSCNDFIQNIEDITSGKARKKSIAHQKAKKDKKKYVAPPSSNSSELESHSSAEGSLPKLSNRPSRDQIFPDHGGAAPPKEIWDIDPSIEILESEP